MSPDDSNQSQPGEERKRPSGRRKPRLGNPDADPERIHREYVERHLGGGEPATPEAYERGVEQWRRLPGAISRAPAELRAPSDEEEEKAAQEEAEPDDSPTAESGGPVSGDQ
jgi:hypothetical protein